MDPDDIEVTVVLQQVNSIHAFFYKNDFLRTTRLKFAQKLRTS